MATDDLKGTFTQAPKSEDEKIFERAESLSKRIFGLTGQLSGDSTSKVDVESTLSSLQEEIDRSPAPEPLPVPSKPGGLGLAAALIAGNMGAVLLRNPNIAAQIFGNASRRIEAADEIERANAESQNAFRLSKHKQTLELRATILERKLQQEMENEKFKFADDTSKALSSVRTAIDLIGAEMDRKHSSAENSANRAARLSNEKPTALSLRDLSNAERDILKAIPSIQENVPGTGFFGLGADKVTKLTDEAANALQTLYLSAIEGGGPSARQGAIKITLMLRDRSNLDVRAAVTELAQLGIPRELAEMAINRVYINK